MTLECVVPSSKYPFPVINRNYKAWISRARARESMSTRCFQQNGWVSFSEASLSGVEPLMQKVRFAGLMLAYYLLFVNRVTQELKLKKILLMLHVLWRNSHIRFRRSNPKLSKVNTMVQEIYRDIKKLDFTKKKITTTITALHRLTMLVSAVEQLQVMASKRQSIYQELE